MTELHISNRGSDMAFEPSEKHRVAIDRETGAVVAVRSIGSSMNFENVEYSRPGSAGLKFDIVLKDVSGEPNVIINATSIERIFHAQGHANEAENTKLVNYILQGLAAVNRKWPLMRRPQFGSNYAEYVRKGTKFSFSIPSDEELKKFTA